MNRNETFLLLNEWRDFLFENENPDKEYFHVQTKNLIEQMIEAIFGNDPVCNDKDKYFSVTYQHESGEKEEQIEIDYSEFGKETNEKEIQKILLNIKSEIES